MHLEHHYSLDLEWTGNRGSGTSSYREYGREHILTAGGKHPIEGSADRTFHGDAGRWNPEEMLLAALAQCHMLSYLHVAVSSGVVVTAYSDSPSGVMQQNDDGSGQFVSAMLRPVVEVADASMVEAAEAAHGRASELCFIAASINFPLSHEPSTVVAK